MAVKAISGCDKDQELIIDTQKACQSRSTRPKGCASTRRSLRPSIITGGSWI